ncbi:biotin/lipoyl-containing protein [Roseiflexus castenholzii]|jgi:biotin carboxyl carrier protein|uniref:Biotin/lipoyl attachment domain-containing protein n=1 Tax=Roseiflexus castenholzii (strain DSM 13941 / HLO8) TaxID=383372 RepID=A7NHW9_ROSCS|nr:acetyl-CoA carboxylase biotin carboxyl carrier protein subunit [Roseiflexus castenholzii]ABU57066.1 biotin/lipoyl attachment domain-containing protein [Roseiflexus castenholzii DSM 13941]
MKVRVLIEGTAYEVEIVDLHSRPVVAIVDGERFEVWPESASALPVGSLDGRQAQAPPASPAPSLSPSAVSAPSAAPPIESGTVRAPIPGVILAVRVKPGDQVTAGQEVCVLEAMKMQNSIRAKQSGVVSAVYVSDGQHVKHHQPLMVIKSE